MTENELYIRIVDEICGRSKPCYDAMCEFELIFLRPFIDKWVRKTKILRGKEETDDIIQSVIARMIQYSEFYFFKPVNGTTTKTLDEFKAWSYTVARNYFYSLLKKYNILSSNEVSFSGLIKGQDSDSDSIVIDFSDPSAFTGSGIEIDEEYGLREKGLSMIFTRVTEYSSKPCIILSWMAVSVLMLFNGGDKIKATHKVIDDFSNLSLYEIFNEIIIRINSLGWLSIPTESLDIIRKKLRKTDKKKGIPVGATILADYYMKKGDEGSISDWYNKIDQKIRKDFGLVDDCVVRRGKDDEEDNDDADKEE